MENLPKSSHLWSYSLSVSPGGCSGAALRLFISLICSGFQENYRPSCWRQFVWHDSTASTRALLPRCCLWFFWLRSVAGTQRREWFIIWRDIILLIYNCWLDKDLVPLIPHPLQNKTLCLPYDLKRSAQQKRLKKLQKSLAIFNFMLILYIPWASEVKIAKELTLFFFFLMWTLYKRNIFAQSV